MKKEKIEKKEDKKDIFDFLEHYKCTICKEEFYFFKDEKDKDNDIFKNEEYAHLPIFLKENPKKITCPYCKASKRSLLYIETEKEKKSKLAKMKEELEKLREEEKRLDKLKEEEIGKLCKEIEKDVLESVKTLIDDLKKDKYDYMHLVKNFKKEAYKVVDQDTKMYNRINKEVNIVLSNRYMAGFDTVISDFSSSIIDAYKVLDKNVSKIKDKEAYDLKKEENSDNTEIKEAAKDDIASEKKVLEGNVKGSKESIGNDFKTYLKNKIK